MDDTIETLTSNPSSLSSSSSSAPSSAPSSIHDRNIDKQNRSSDTMQRILHEAIIHIDDRKIHPEDFKLSPISLNELRELITNIKTYRCTIEALEKKRDTVDVCDPKCKTIDFDKAIANTTKKLINNTVTYLDKMAEICSGFSHKYKQRLCRIISKIQKYGCKGLADPIVILNEIDQIQTIIDVLNKLKFNSNQDVTEMSTVSLFNGECCDDRNMLQKQQRREMCEMHCSDAKEAALEEINHLLDMQSLDLQSNTCEGILNE